MIDTTDLGSAPSLYTSFNPTIEPLSYALLNCIGYKSNERFTANLVRFVLAPRNEQVEPK